MSERTQRIAGNTPSTPASIRILRPVTLTDGGAVGFWWRQHRCFGHRTHTE